MLMCRLKEEVPNDASTPNAHVYDLCIGVRQQKEASYEHDSSYGDVIPRFGSTTNPRRLKPTPTLLLARTHTHLLSSMSRTSDR